MAPTMMFSTVADGLNLDVFAGPDESDHQAEESQGGEGVDEVGHKKLGDLLWRKGVPRDQASGVRAIAGSSK